VHALTHVPEKWSPVFPIRTCATKEFLEFVALDRLPGVTMWDEN
jgi:hypothetical protein